MQPAYLYAVKIIQMSGDQFPYFICEKVNEKRRQCNLDKIIRRIVLVYWHRVSLLFINIIMVVSVTVIAVLLSLSY